LDGADRSEERDACQVDVSADDGAEDAPPPELAIEGELECLSRLCLRTIDGRGGSGLSGGCRGCLHGGPNRVASGLLGRETTLLDAREERHEEEQGNQHTREEDQPGYERLTILPTNAG
jgi:hypothetical protein